MEYNIFVHGVTIGHDFCCDDPGMDAGQYLDSFYKQQEKYPDTKFVVRKNNNYYYYTYLVYKYNGIGLQDANSREGSYFGITLRFRRFYKDIRWIYQILESCYVSHVFGKILEKTSNGRLKHKLNQFHSYPCSPDLDRLFKAIEGRFRDCLNSRNFIDLNPVESGPPLCLNLYECDDSRLLDLFKKSGKIDLSVYYPTKEVEVLNKNLKEKDGEISQLENVIKEKNGEISQLENVIKEKDGEISKLENSIKEKTDQIASLQTEKSSWKDQIGKLQEKFTYSSSSEHKRTLENIYDMVAASLGKPSPQEQGYAMGGALQSQREESRNSKKKGFLYKTKNCPLFKRRILILIPILILLIGAYFFYSKSSTGKPLYWESQKIESRNSSPGSSEQSQRIKDFSNCRIDIGGYHKPDNGLYEGKKYKITLIDRGIKRAINVEEYGLVWNVRYKNNEHDSSYDIKIDGNTFELGQNQQSGDTIIVELKNPKSDSVCLSREIPKSEK